MPHTRGTGQLRVLPGGRLDTRTLRERMMSGETGKPGNGDDDEPLSDAEAEDHLLGLLGEIEERLSAASDFRLEVAILRAEMTQRQAQRRRRP